MIDQKIDLGLFTKVDRELVAVMTFTTGSAMRNSNNLELSRFTTIFNTSVIGAFSKMLKWFFKNYTYTEIFTYADLRYNNGDMYEKTGWEIIKQSQPDYYYVKDKICIIKLYIKKKI